MTRLTLEPLKSLPSKTSPLKLLTLENIAFKILSLGGTEPQIHLEGHLPPPQLQRTFKKISSKRYG